MRAGAAFAIAAAVAIVGLTGSAGAQTPGGDTRAITLVVPIAAGGGVDAIGRLMAEKLQERLKQPVVVENRVGAGGAVGADSVAKAAPDGRTLLLIETSSTLHKWLHKNVPFDVVADFAPVARVASTSLLLFGHPSFAPNNVAEVIAAGQGQPRQAFGRHARHRHAASSRHADDERERQDRHRARALSRHRPRAQRPARRPDPDDLGDAGCRHAARREPAR